MVDGVGLNNPYQPMKVIVVHCAQIKERKIMKKTKRVKYHLHTEQRRLLMSSSNLEKLEKHARPGDYITMTLV